MKHKIAVVLSLAILIFTIGSVNFAAAQYCTLSTYQSDYTTPKTVFSSTDTVYIKWAEEYPEGFSYRIEVRNWATGEEFVTETESKTLSLGPLTPGNWHVHISEYTTATTDFAACTFTVAEPSIIVTPENDFGSLVALVGCLAAFGALGVYRLKKN